MAYSQLRRSGRLRTQSVSCFAGRWRMPLALMVRRSGGGGVGGQIEVEAEAKSRCEARPQRCGVYAMLANELVVSMNDTPKVNIATSESTIGWMAAKARMPRTMPVKPIRKLGPNTRLRASE